MVVVGDSPVVPETTTPSWPWSTRWRGDPRGAVEVDRAVVVERGGHRGEDPAEGRGGRGRHGDRLSLRRRHVRHHVARHQPRGGRGRRGRAPGGRAARRRGRRTARSCRRPPAGVPARPFSRSSAGSRPIAAARRSSSASSAPTQSTRALDQRIVGGVAVRRLAGLPDPGELRPGRRLVDERQVELVGVRRGQRGRALLADAADEHRRLGLAPAWAARASRSPGSARPSKEKPPVGRPQPGDDRELLLEPVEALAGARERDAVLRVLLARTSRRRCRARPGRRSSGRRWRR